MTVKLRDYGFLDWSGDSGFKFALGSSIYLAFCLVSSQDYGTLRRGLLSLRGQLGLPGVFEFHFAETSIAVRTAFFATLLHLPWNAVVLLVDKRELPAEFKKMQDTVLYGHFISYLVADAPLSVVQVKRLLVDESCKQTQLLRGMRVAMSPVLRARGIQQTPKVRGEPAQRWDGLQLADMLAGAVVARETSGRNYLQGLRKLRVYRYEVQE